LLIGLERGTQPGHIARAALESIAFQVADVMEAMNKETQNPFRELRVDGGAAANDLLMQCQADISGIPVTRPEQVETTALGAAYLAGLATGFWESPQQIQKLHSEGRRFTPKPDRTRAQHERDRWREAVSRARGWNHPQGSSQLSGKGETA
jgi:glycerol kinase